ncbi:LLM class flavin-dependent oxidoreductase [Steroidobacter denitrificans]|nr:LLM class flavin-dependent oxidoreductase [Steroidobacter denitrificans]
MDIVIGPYGMQSPHSYRRSHADMYDDLIVHAQKAEELGYDGIAVTEHSFWYDGYCPALLPALASLAVNTTRIKLVTGALLIPQHDPLKIAEQAAVLDRLSNGRLVLGLGAGYRPEEFHGHGVEIGRIGSRFIEAFEVVRRALTEETFSFSGEYYNYSNVSLKTRPQQREMPMWVCGGFADWSVKAAAKRGWSYCTTGDADCGMGVFDRYAAFAREFGRDPSTLKRAKFVDVYLAASEEEAAVTIEQDYWPAMRDQFIGFGFFRLKNPDGTQVTEPPPGMKEQFITNPNRPRGSPAHVREMFKPVTDYGVDMLLARLSWANFRNDRMLESMELFAREVMPALRQRSRK